MTIGARIISGFTIVLLLFLLVAGSAYYARNYEQDSYERYIVNREAIVDSASELRIVSSTQIQHYRGMFLFPNQQAYYIRELDQDNERFAKALAAVRNALGHDHPELTDIAELQAEMEKRIRQAIELVRKQKTGEAIAMSEREMLPLAREMTRKTEHFRNTQLAATSQERGSLRAVVDKLAFGITALSLLGFTLCLWTAATLTRAIHRQLSSMVTQLASSSSEILAMTTQMAGGATETATAVNQTTTTVEEVKQTAQVNSAKARHVSEIAQQTAQVSKSGEDSVMALIASIDRIRAQNATTADSIRRLSEQSQAIGEIMASVNDLAEQSNLLAVNASIEAAKAGDQGKGFGVVAQEVRSLAQQSRQATAQVRTLLSDIQKATGAAVMANDLNGKAVEEGSRYSDDAGRTIRALADNIDNAAQAALQIATSSQQQLIGMDQVALAMDNIKEASAQNMAGSKQAEIAARNLHELGVKLKSMVER